MQADVDAQQKLAAYFETDFLGAAPTANSVESNSYNPRLRQAYGTYDNNAWGLHVLAGQSLAQGRGVNPLGDEVLDRLGAWWEAGPCVTVPAAGES